MAQKELKKEEWQDFFADFSSNYQTRYITLTVETPGMAEKTEFESLPLISIEPNTKDEQNYLEIIAGETAGEDPQTATRRIVSPQSIYIEENDGVEAITISFEGGKVYIEIL